MKPGGFRSMSVTMLLLAASVAIMAAASVGRLQGTAGRNLTIAVVDTRTTSAARNEFRAEIAQALSVMLNETFGSNLAVRTVYVGGRDAKLKLKAGNYDAALVIGADRPFSLRRMELQTFAGSMMASNGVQPVSLIVGNSDPALCEQLRAAFARLIAKRMEPYVANPSDAAKLATIGG